MSLASEHSGEPGLELINRLLTVLDTEVLPMTEAAVMHGNKVFGAALLKKSDYSTYLTETNNEIESPLHHGEMHLIKRYFEIPKNDRIAAEDLIFLSSHEPCSMCLSAITWSGFDNFYYLFSHEDSRDSFVIPHDLNILWEVFGLKAGQYRKNNKFWRCHSMVEWCEKEAPAALQSELQQTIRSLKARYTAASNLYQQKKEENSIPLR